MANDMNFIVPGHPQLQQKLRILYIVIFGLTLHTHDREL